ncbi:zinc finger CCCH domain-containing protein 3 isoform X2 [Hypanus sabinus]|uniref:zinc finger CCCH domain-containing protein 3 isoform X2 n=1 Tax=Hypanus sabinus TaxID=79690 RepID=UPI0028C37F43|nr:zinc finger CCCH domain-containing protein 3 isoform X2 [Hypanus sabinus]
MEERAVLERQIRLLSALITNHKNVHGDVPAVPASCSAHGQGPWAKSNPKFTSVCPQKVPLHHGSESSSSWRTKYSLVNKKPVDTVGETFNVPRGHIMPAGVREQNTVRKCMVKTTVSGDGNLVVKSDGEVQANPRAQSLLDMNSQLAVKKDKLLGLKAKLDKVKMTRKMNVMDGAKLISSNVSTVRSASKQEEERNSQIIEKKKSLEASGNIKGSASYNCCTTLAHCSTKTPYMETSTIATFEASKYTLQKTYLKSKVHGIASETAQEEGKFPQVMESNSGVRTDLEISIEKLHRPTGMNKIADLAEHNKNDSIKSAKVQNASNPLDQVLFSTSPIKISKYTWQKGSDLNIDSSPHRCQNETLNRVIETASPCASQLQTTNVIGISLKSKFPLSLRVHKKQRASTPLCNRMGKGRKAKYVWVSSTAQLNQSMKSTELARKSVSPRLVKSTVKCVAGSSSTALSLDPGVRSAGKHKKATSCQKIGGLSSKYRWKAMEAVSPSKSLYQWKSQDSYKTRSSNHQTRTVSLKKTELAIDVPKKVLNESASTHYKLKSTTKIIRRNGGKSSPTEKKTNTGGFPVMKSRYLLVKKSPVHGKSTPILKRTPGKGLVQISKHRLQRLPTSAPHGSAKQGLSSSFSVKNPSSNKLINTRYKIVKKNAGWNNLTTSSSAFSWKTKKINNSCVRSLLLNRARVSNSYRFLQQRWKTKGMRCIEGVLYRVSANKLAKSSSVPIRTGVTNARSAVKSAIKSETVLDNCDLYLSSSLTKTFTNRHIASRAVQRSLAIIRQAKLKKSKKKEYCMYYNRFGKCNRGDNCPYIHDPEKVAVCTRFLRGTCKKTDGTCPFSHQVSKDKMPVCSYYLKGICSSNNCPYSHVYVSRKAEVCQDFLKGYCPLGAKCKKKHTLICPEFSKTGNCTQGSKCKLQHRQQKSHKQKPAFEAAQGGTTDEGTGSKRIRLAGNAERDKEVSRQVNSMGRTVSSSDSGEVSSSSNSNCSQHGLPAFIALHSSVSSEEKVDSEVEEERESEALGKPIQIKPRF